MPDKDVQRRILVVDDEEGIRLFVDRVLRDAGYETCVATDGESALRLIEQGGTFDLLLTDLNMPEMTGDELSRRVRLLHPDLSVLYLTGFADRLFTARATLWENEAFVEKPVSIDGLREAVSLALFGTTQHTS
jgi:two-component system cell cycle sensor histidine kinase/response regulator CckA